MVGGLFRLSGLSPLAAQRQLLPLLFGDRRRHNGLQLVDGFLDLDILDQSQLRCHQLLSPLHKLRIPLGEAVRLAVPAKIPYHSG